MTLIYVVTVTAIYSIMKSVRTSDRQLGGNNITYDVSASLLRSMLPFTKIQTSLLSEFVYLLAINNCKIM